MAETLTPRVPASPTCNPGDAVYFEAAASDRLLLKRCRECGAHHHYPRALCPFCWSGNVDWVDATGRGEIYSFSVTRRGPGSPYCIAYIQLEEGPKMMTNIVDADFDGIRIGQPVEVVFQKSVDGVSIPMFRPVTSDEGVA